MFKTFNKKYIYCPLQDRASFVDPFLLFVFHVCHSFLSLPCSLVVTYWERADLLALLCVHFCVCVTFSYGILGQIFDCIDS